MDDLGFLMMLLLLLRADKGKKYPVKVSGVEIVPDPVARGEPATFKISASTGIINQPLPFPPFANITLRDAVGVLVPP